jgi:hypothetical protein
MNQVTHWPMGTRLSNYIPTTESSSKFAVDPVEPARNDNAASMNGTYARLTVELQREKSIKALKATKPIGWLDSYDQK